MGLAKMRREAAYYLRVLQELIFPRRCAVCGSSIDTGYLCEACAKGYLLQRTLRFEPREEYLAGQAEPRAEDVLLSVTVLYKYEGELKKALHRLKFEGAAELLPLLREQAEVALPSAKLRWLSQFDVITCVPTSPERQKQRGFDVPQELFAPLLDERGGEFQAVVLERVRHTTPLYELKPELRRSELAGCFALAPRVQVAGKCVLLCDDIFTTGSTMAEAARVLRQAGAREVHGLAFTSAGHWD